MRKSNGADSARSSTGITGLDDILMGGLPRHRLYLVQGTPGAGKTTLALQYLLHGLRTGDKALYITLSETRDELEEVARSHNWSLENIEVLELSAIEEQLAGQSQHTLFHPSEVELSQTTQLLLAEVERVKPARMVFDSLSELRLLSQTPLRYRRQILAFKQYLTGRKCTTLLLDDGSSGSADEEVQSLAHGVLVLEQVAPSYGSERRRLMVVKIRGSKYRGGYHDFSIQTGGIAVFPRLIAAEHHRKFEREEVSSGLEGIDTLLGGGFSRGTSNLLIGPAGSGKSTIALKTVLTAAARGEKTAIYTFDESLGTMNTRADALGLSMQPFIERGLISIHQIDPAELSPGQFANEIRRAVEEEGARLVQIDSLNGYLHSMGEERALSLQLHELLTYLNQQGIVTLLTLAPHGMLGTMHAPVDVTYLADTVLVFRYFEAGGAVRKAVSVLKKRTGRHEITIRELTIARAAITVGPPLANLRGVFSGIPVPHAEGELRATAPRDHDLA